MLIRVKELELRKLEFNENLPPGAVDFGPDFRQVGDLHAEGRAELIVEHRGVGCGRYSAGGQAGSELSSVRPVSGASGSKLRRL